MKKRLNIYRSFSVLLLALSVALSFSSCSVYMAVNAGEKKNEDILLKGTPRAQVIAELGSPESSDVKDGVLHEIFRFQQGAGKAAKTGRAIVHGTANLFTIGLWEVVGTPVEKGLQGDEIVLEIQYNDDLLVENAMILKGNF